MRKDLSTVENSMTSIIQANHERFDVCSTPAELVVVLKEVFAENNLNTKASQRLILNVSRHRTIFSALKVVYDSMLFGSNLAVDRK